MKTLARVRFKEGLIQALQNSKKFPDLHLYCSHWINTLDSDTSTMLCEVVDDVDIKTGKPKKTLDIELALFDYFFNVSCEVEELERKHLWQLVDNKITWTVIKTVTI